MNTNHNFVAVDYLFRGKENRIVYYIESNSTLKIEIEEKNSNLEWVGSFSSEYIEELTKKTGNFKSFDVFTAMLQTILTQTSDSLSLDLMSYSDLEELRNLKMGSLGLGKSTPVVNREASRQNKRYLILTYTTDFDKVHYPLPMTFQGMADVKALKNTIQELRRQIYSFNQGGTDYEKYEISELNKKILQLKNENDQLVSTLHKYKNQWQSSESNDDLKKELKAVKSIVRSLEDELTEEKSKHQRILMRKNRENKTLIDEVSELKASKRNLNFRLHNLTNELAIYKRQRGKNGFTSPRPPVCPSPKSSFDLLVDSSKRLSRSARTSSPHMFSDPETMRTAHISRRALSNSLADRVSNNFRRCSSADRYRSSSPKHSKFDPTAYVELQNLKRKEIQEKKKRELRYRLNSSNLSDRSRDSSPVSYRNIHPSLSNNYKSNLISSSNASSTSNLDEKPVNGKFKVKSTTNKYGLNNFPDKKRLPTPLNNGTDDERSENESSYKYDHHRSMINRKIPSGFKSDDSSVTGQGDYKTKRNENKKSLRRRLLDSEDDENDVHSLRTLKSDFNKKDNLLPRKSRIQQNNEKKQLSYNQSDDISDIDRRLNNLQVFFQKYLHN